MYDYLPTPAVLVELEAAERNIRWMVENNKKYGIKIRPHIKPHKSVFLARLQLEMGCAGVTCAKLGEAEVMAEAGITDILNVFPLIGEDKMERLGVLLDKADVKTIVNSLEGAGQLSLLACEKGREIKVLIDVDGGLRRGGKKPGIEAVEFALEVKKLSGLQICGLMYYSGIINKENNLEGYKALTVKEQKDIDETAGLMRQAGIDLEIISGGNSYSAKLPELFYKESHTPSVTELRPGNFIFNNSGSLVTGFASEDECALRVVSTVVAMVDDNHAIIDAGSKTLTTDRCLSRSGFGYVAGRPDIYIDNLNEEHGFISSKEGLNLRIGDKIAIIPNHACVVPNLADYLYGIRGGKIERMIKVDARGMNR